MPSSSPPQGAVTQLERGHCWPAGRLAEGSGRAGSRPQVDDVVCRWARPPPGGWLASQLDDYLSVSLSLSIWDRRDWRRCWPGGAQGASYLSADGCDLSAIGELPSARRRQPARSHMDCSRAEPILDPCLTEPVSLQSRQFARWPARWRLSFVWGLIQLDLLKRVYRRLELRPPAAGGH